MPDRTVLSIAEGYPFDRPLHGFVLIEGETRDGGGCIEGRRPVLAIGSNGAPDQLRRKFGVSSSPLPVTPVILHGHAIVYSAHLTAYGSLPAALYALPGAQAFLSVTWLDDTQLEAMHLSEALGINYDFHENAPLDVRWEDGKPVAPVGVYSSRRGTLLHDGQPIRLAEMPTTGTSLPALTQPAALRYVHQRLASPLSYESFIARVVAEADFREEVNALLPTLP